MKKWMVLATTSLIMMNAHADKSWCGYKDYFRLSDASHPGIYVVSGFNDQDVILQLIGPRSFEIRDSFACRSGYAHVTVAYDAENWCVLDIKDGPLMNHPTVSASCNGIRYINTVYDGIGSYSYTINLD
ncbi:TPA: hypothetical protein ACPSKY_000939 [Legionella bozemanae]|jgi:hypothetical protein|uniref:Secreted protein n=1 Tax=Legionella bozemanae TaxID=447 RepID=A0A0W0RVI7_LEGBO|nr:hypothetical protein [Legionella bozemanae]KTC75100.1 hypothetical protein Lboz_1087 [Legionella bozemanae]STO35122.1 Uncharacterised protein [Legionella bozemanae]